MHDITIPISSSSASSLCQVHKRHSTHVPSPQLSNLPRTSPSLHLHLTFFHPMSHVLSFVTPAPFHISRAHRAVHPLQKPKYDIPPRAVMPLLNWLFPRATASNAPINAPTKHAVLGNSPEKPEGGWKQPLQEAMFGLGCFWGAERKFWTADGVHTTSVGYAGGSKENPTYRQVCSGRTGHAEVVNVVFDETKTSYEDILDIFWEAHDPTTLNRQGNDVGTQYRSAIYYFSDDQKRLAVATRDRFNALLKEADLNPTTTEIAPASDYYFAEEYHQQYLHKNPMGYCGIAGTGIYRPRPRES